MTKPLSFDRALGRHLKELDRLYAQLRGMHADPAQRCRDSKEHKEFLQELIAEGNAIFRLKEVWAAVPGEEDESGGQQP